MDQFRRIEAIWIIAVIFFEFLFRYTRDVLDRQIQNFLHAHWHRTIELYFVWTGFRISLTAIGTCRLSLSGTQYRRQRLCLY
jgi:hypothetical protein